MSLRTKRREERSAENSDGLIAVQRPEGNIEHISREQWEEENNGESPDE